MKGYYSVFLLNLFVVACVEGFQSPAGAIATTRTPTKQIGTTTDPSRASSPSALLRRPPFATPRRQATALSASSKVPLKNLPYDDQCDVLVLGSGPAARAIASLLSADKQLDVLLSDQRLDSEWPANYGVWKQEWQAILDRYAAAGVTLKGGQAGQAIDREWPVTDCYFGGSFGIPTTQRMRLDRPYCRVDRNALRDSLTSATTYRTLQANHMSQAIGINLYTPTNSLVHDAEGTTIQLQTANGNTRTIRSKLVVDCTGHETKLVLRDSHDQTNLPPGFQIAYGVLVNVDETNSPDRSMIGPYDKEAMTLFDYRTDHYDSADKPTQQKVAAAPTFMYAMPLTGNQIFFEETSLVARPAVSFQECKDRCIQRLSHLGIAVTAVQEEEFCYIPMGGALPAKDQRIVGLGGAAAMVHPSTGFHLCRCMMGAADVAEVLRDELLLSSSSSSSGSEQQAPNLDRAAANAYHALWSPENVRQRNFAVFGGEFLMKQDVVGLRGFFDGFFRLPEPLWAGFLAGWPGLPNNSQHERWWARMWFGLSFIVRIPFPVALDMALSIASYSLSQGAPLPQSVTPFLGAPDSFEYRPNQDGVGDVAAKQEARSMIQASKTTEDLPVAFGAAAGTTEEKGGTVVDVAREFARGGKQALAAERPEPVVVE